MTLQPAELIRTNYSSQRELTLLSIMVGELRSSLRYCWTIRTDQSLASESAAAGGKWGAVTQKSWEALIAAAGIRTRREQAG